MSTLADSAGTHWESRGTGENSSLRYFPWLEMYKELPSLHCEYPSYIFSLVNSWHGLSIAAMRKDDSNGPLCVISSDIGELREILKSR